MDERVEGTRLTPHASDDGRDESVTRSYHDVLVSYSTSDKPVADAIVSRLEQGGIRCWVAPRDVIPGVVSSEAIVQAIEASRLMVVVLSGESNQSRQVLREVERAVANNVVIVPFRIESIEPTGAMEFFLAPEHCLDAVTPPLEAHIEQLVRVVRARLLIALPKVCPDWWLEAPSREVPCPTGAPPPPSSVRIPLPRIATISALTLVVTFLVLALLV